MEVQECVAVAEKHKECIAWRKKHQKAFLSYFFSEGEAGQVGFYDADTDKVFSLKMDNGMNITASWEDSVFRNPDKKIEQLTLDNVTLQLGNVKSAAQSFFEEKYNATPLIKTLFILEKTPDFGVAWNITFVTKSLQLIIIKLDPVTGKLLDEQVMQLT